MLVVGLTGGIGSGKSTVARLFTTLGVPVVDADHLAYELVMPGQPALQEIAQAFGPQILAPNGNLDRAALRQRVFANAAERELLESILHPRIRSAMQANLQMLESATYAILMVPLLLETGQTDLCHRILIVDIPELLQIERITSRNGYSSAEIHAILKAQCSRAQRLAVADDIIDNCGDIDYLTTQIATLHNRYLSLG